MEADATARTRGVEETLPDHEWMADVLDGAIEEAARKVESGRVYDVKNEEVRIKWIRALAYAVNVRRQVTADRDLEELSDQVDRLERLQEAR